MTGSLTPPLDNAENKRRRLRLALREARREANLSQQATAQRLGWSYKIHAAIFGCIYSEQPGVLRQRSSGGRHLPVRTRDEAALIRPAGSAEIMREQIAALRRYAREGDINLYLLPFSAGVHRGMGAAFTVLQMLGPEDSDVLYLGNADRVVGDPEQVGRQLDLFVYLHELAESSGDFDAAAELIEKQYLA